MWFYIVDRDDLLHQVGPAAFDQVPEVQGRPFAVEDHPVYPPSLGVLVLEDPGLV